MARWAWGGLGYGELISEADLLADREREKLRALYVRHGIMEPGGTL